MTALLHVTQAVELVVVCAVAVLAHRGRQHQTAATAWALGVFGGVGLVVLLSLFPVDDDGSFVRHGYTVFAVSVLLLVPYLLVRFTVSLGALGRAGDRLAAVLVLLMLATSVLSPEFPSAGESWTRRFTAYVVLMLVGWTAQVVLFAGPLWSAGRAQPAVVRHRMQALSSGAVALALALVGSSGLGGPPTTLQVVTTVTGTLGICLFALAFVVPTWLAAAWRSGDVARLVAAERRLMAAVTPRDVANAIVPAVVTLFGAAGAALLDEDGHAITVAGTPHDVVADLGTQLRGQARDEVVTRTAGGDFACRLEDGWLVVRPSRFAPLFSASEVHLLDRVGSFTDLVLQRCQHFKEQARSQRATKATNAELQALIYSVSHDLQNPVISVLGYLEVLEREHRGELSGDGEHYLERISINAQYMQHLIQDLLELSRIGRSEPPAQVVALGELAESVAQELRAQHPGCRITVDGQFPVAWMSELRARELLTNIVDNAAKYRGSGTRVLVRAERLERGAALLTVTDDGKGIPPHLREKAFDVFERLDAAHSDIPGTGMGLPICKRIVDTIGGSIVIDGPPPGQDTGTTVSVQLPGAVVLGWAQLGTAEREHAS
jgi:signal transduction histidine kinase